MCFVCSGKEPIVKEVVSGDGCRVVLVVRDSTGKKASGDC